jgi:hypothetical protein
LLQDKIIAAVTSLVNVRDKRGGASTNAPTPATGVEVGLLTRGCDKPYAFGLAQRAAGLFIAPNTFDKKLD